MPASIRGHLAVLLIALAVPLVALVGFNIFSELQDAVEQAKLSLRVLASTMATNAGRKITDTRTMLERLAARPRVKAADADRCDEVLQELHSLSPGYSNIVYTDIHGRTLCSAHPLPDGRTVDVGGTEWFRKAAQGGRFSIGTPHFGPITGKWVTVFSLPIRNDDGKMVGLIHLPLDLDAYDPGIPVDFLPADSRYGFVDADGAMIWRNLDSGKATGIEPDADTVRRVIAAREGEFESVADDGIVRYFSMMSVPESGWVAYIGVPRDSIHAHARERAVISAFLSLAGLAVLVLLMLALARRIGRPIHSLVTAVREVGAGNLAVRASPSGPAELREVAIEFNAMVDARLYSEALFREVTESIREAFWIVTPDWRTVKYISPAYEKIWGEPVETLYQDGLRWMAAVPEKYRKAIRAAIPKPELLAECEIVQFPDYPILRPDGTQRWVSARAYPVRNAAGGVVHFAGIAEDISERKLAEAELEGYRHKLEALVDERTAALGQALRDQEAFSYSVSHDLRAPLRAIHGFARILLEDERSRLSGEGRMLLDRIVHNAARMDGLIDDILAYSSSSRREIEPSEVDLGALARQAVSDLGANHPNAEIEIGPLPVVRGDPTMLGQIMQNLIGNALKFSAKRERPRIGIGTREDAGEQVFFVRDNGTGFDMAHADRLFGIFQRLHGENQFPGTGVGLAIVKRLVERHGGRIWAEAEPDRGATFNFTLPGPLT
jgi:PAS domain S-box-containing protein